MVIQNSEVSMASKSSIARETKMTIQSETKPVINFTGINIPVNTQTSENKEVEKEKSLLDQVNTKSNRKVRLHTMEYLFRMLVFGRYMDEDSAFGRMMRENFGDGDYGTGLDAAGMMDVEPMFVETTRISYQYQEKQSLEFSSTGTAITADGRKLSFDYSFAMSEAFVESYENIHSAIRQCVDPLVINLDDSPTSIADQTFFFDLDGDGEADELHNLGKGAAFLALDRNEDGIINDGMELFGARTGDGFGELEEFDEDGNGWIDENDPIFTKLRVMTINEKGEQELYGLKESDVGAICLKRLEGNFFHHDKEHEMTAITRKSGIFLHESDGHAGGVQHVDFAK